MFISQNESRITDFLNENIPNINESIKKGKRKKILFRYVQESVEIRKIRKRKQFLEYRILIGLEICVFHDI